jgi:hypothetical protein
LSGPWVEGVTVTLGGGGSGVATTDSAGRYAFNGLTAGHYTITPSLSGYTYSPATSQVDLSANVTGFNFSATSAVPSYSVSGTVSYSGSKVGRAYVMANCVSVAGCVVSQHPGKHGSPTAATSVATAGGAYTLRGLAPGSYTLTAVIDAQGSGFINGSDPAGTSSFTITASNLAGVNVSVTDPVLTTPAAGR